MYAFLTVGEDGDEGVPAVQHGRQVLPLVAADGARVDSLRPVAPSRSRGSRAGGSCWPGSRAAATWK